MPLVSPAPASEPAVSKHLKVLERAGLVERAADGRRRPARLRAEPLEAATDWLIDYRAFWEPRFERLDQLLNELVRQADLEHDDA